MNYSNDYTLKPRMVLIIDHYRDDFRIIGRISQMQRKKLLLLLKISLVSRPPGNAPWLKTEGHKLPFPLTHSFSLPCAALAARRPPGALTKSAFDLRVFSTFQEQVSQQIYSSTLFNNFKSNFLNLCWASKETIPGRVCNPLTREKSKLHTEIYI